MKFKFYFFKLSLVCIVIYILQLIIPGFIDFFILNQNAINGEYWRFLTAIFLHGSLIHLLYNIFALLLFGFALERVIGSFKFIFLFLLSGIIANIIAVNFYPSSLGASGAIYGIIGCLAIIKPFMVVWAFGLLMPIFVAAILWTIGDILGIFGFGAENIGNIAHLTGIAVGIFIGFFWKGKFRKKRENKIEIPEVYINQWEKRYIRR